MARLIICLYMLQFDVESFKEKTICPFFSYLIDKIEEAFSIGDSIDDVDVSVYSGNFSVKGYLLLIRRDSATHMHGLAVYVKERLPFAQDLSLENSADSYLCF